MECIGTSHGIRSLLTNAELHGIAVYWQIQLHGIAAYWLSFENVLMEASVRHDANDAVVI